MQPTASNPNDNQVALAIDIGSSSVRALLYDRNGHQIGDSEIQLPYRQHVTNDGGSESDPDGLLRAVCECIDGICNNIGDRQVVAIGITCFWHGLLGVARNNTSTTPVYMWSDKRSGRDAERLTSEISIADAHARTGCRIHSSYWPAKLRWLERTQPGQFTGTARWVSVTDFIMEQITGTLATSVSMASGTGLLNARTLDWDSDMLSLLGLTTDQLPPIVDRTQPYPDLRGDFAARWPALAHVPWYPAIGDGAAANVGSGCVGASRIAFTIGTSAAMRLVLPDADIQNDIPDRIWRYRLDRDHAVIGGALSNGGNAAAWMADRLDGEDLDSLTAGAATLEPDAHGLTVLPLFAGERSPSWNEHATGTITGLRHATTSADMFRATLEASAYRLAAIYDDLAPAASSSHEIHANGAAALGSPLWLQIIADTLGHEILAVDAEAEASARGAAICALQAAGYIDTLIDTDRSIATSYRPDMDHHTVYHAAKERQTRLEHALNMMEKAPA
jgi:gluconokinase